MRVQDGSLFSGQKRFNQQLKTAIHAWLHKARGLANGLSAWAHSVRLQVGRNQQPNRSVDAWRIGYTCGFRIASHALAIS